MQSSAKNPFYVVSMGKFTALFIGTMGLYGLYWFYQNWYLLDTALKAQGSSPAASPTETEPTSEQDKPLDEQTKPSSQEPEQAESASNNTQVNTHHASSPPQDNTNPEPQNATPTDFAVAAKAALRSIFNFIFIPSLCMALAKQERLKGQQYRWNPLSVAMGYIAFQVMSVSFGLAVSREVLSIHWILIQIPLLFGHYVYLYKFQLVANRVCDDPYGKSNHSFSINNHIWIVFGIVLWIDEIRRIYLLLTGQMSL